MENNFKPPVISGYLSGGGEMGQLTRNFDWASTKLGPPESWPVNLLSTVSIILNSRFPMFLWWGEDLVQFYNDAYRPSLGHEGKHPGALGGKAVDYWPEIWGVIHPLIKRVMSTLEPTWSEDQLIPIFRNGKMENVYWTFGYSSVNDEHGNSCGVLVICNETTQKVEALHELLVSQEACKAAQLDAEKQRDHLKQFLIQAPAGICILEGADLHYDFVNEGYQQFFPGRELLGKALLDAIPEIRDQEIHHILTRVLITGKTYHGEAQLIPLAYDKDGPVIDRYFNFIYQAKFNKHGKTDGVIVFAFEVTDMVMALEDLEVSQKMLRLALNAGQIGTWTVDLKTMGLKVSDRTAQLFGLDESETITLDAITAIIIPEHREKVIAARQLCIDGGKDYDQQYSILPAGSGVIKWVHSIGKVEYDLQGNGLYISGTVIDISEQRMNEIKKNDFIGMVSHELKTPLTSMGLYMQFLASKARGMQDQLAENTISRVKSQLNKMDGLINGFLDISRLESNKISLKSEPFRLDTLIEECVEELRLINSGFSVEYRFVHGVIVSADRYKISSVLNNLLSNAIKYSAGKKLVLIDCQPLGGLVRVSITDNGIGIKQAELKQIFERFYRVESDATRTTSGFGIGLYLASEIINLHGGRIWGESEFGIGSVFNFELPLA